MRQTFCLNCLFHWCNCLCSEGSGTDVVVVDVDVTDFAVLAFAAVNGVDLVVAVIAGVAVCGYVWKLSTQSVTPPK